LHPGLYPRSLITKREASPLETDYYKIGLKVGLEIHQQLRTKEKLFCSCKPALFKEEPEITFLRRLRPTQSELGQVDPAAYFEFQKGVRISYEANSATSCLVEMDEEPPHPLNLEAVETVLTAALMIKAQPIDEIHVMRKTVIDGSNTTGFQRTCVIALNGWIEVEGKNIPIQHASLEEDAARKTGEEQSGNIIHYRIDRLGIPLIEIATEPVIYSPNEAQKVALAIGKILRNTGKVMRGLGSIRQDLNVSLPNGALMEIKGVQELELISKVVEYEVQRQLRLIEISKELQETGVKEQDIRENFVKVTQLFKKTKCKVIRRALERKQEVLAVKLSKFSGFLKRELMPNFRLGTEFSDRARFWGRVGGIFHTDEMPAYDVSPEEIESVRKAVETSEKDAVVFVADTNENSCDALRAVVERAREAIIGVPAETRTAKTDGTTRYMRPRPGAARMYPETDIPPVSITDALITRTLSSLPEPAGEKLARFYKEYDLNEKLAKQIIDSEYCDLFEAIIKESDVSATVVAAFMTETLKALQRDGVQVERVTDEKTKEIFKLISAGLLAKEAAADVFIWLSKHEYENAPNAIANLNLQMFSKAELEELIDRVIATNKKSVESLGQRALGVLIGSVMKQVRGRADPNLVSELVKERLK
jgi:glutamyl-tRNA(Gln) amidotransferase subunit E